MRWRRPPCSASRPRPPRFWSGPWILRCWPDCSTAAPALASRAREVRLARSQLPWLAGAIGAGGVVGPILLMIGLARTDAAAASLLLTLEGVATALMAWFIFHENFDRRVAAGMACLLAGAA